MGWYWAGGVLGGEGLGGDDSREGGNARISIYEGFLVGDRSGFEVGPLEREYLLMILK